MNDKQSTQHHIITLSNLRPTQMTVGMLQVKHKRQQLRTFEKRPAELVGFILEHPIRVVLGPADKAYVIDHHHLALALVKEDFITAPMEIEDDYSSLSLKSFWKKLQAQQFVHPVDASGKYRSISALPNSLKHMEDDPYRSLAGFAREAGAFLKVGAPFAEFAWADYYRDCIRKKLLKKDFQDALDKAVKLARHKDASTLPGYIKPK